MPVDDEGPTVDGLHRRSAAGVGGGRGDQPGAEPDRRGRVTPARADALRALLAAAPDVLVIEDDHAAELAEASRWRRWAGAGRPWAFVRSVSKPYGPDLRVAVVAGDEATCPGGGPDAAGRRLGVHPAAAAGGRAVAGRGRVPGAWSGRARLRGPAGGAAAARSPSAGIVCRGRTGINVWVPVADETAAVAALRDRGWAVAPGSLYRLASPPAIRLTVSPLDHADIEPLADAVAAVLRPSDPPPATGLAR